MALVSYGVICLVLTLAYIVSGKLGFVFDVQRVAHLLVDFGFSFGPEQLLVLSFCAVPATALAADKRPLPTSWYAVVCFTLLLNQCMVTAPQQWAHMCSPGATDPAYKGNFVFKVSGANPVLSRLLITCERRGFGTYNRYDHLFIISPQSWHSVCAAHPLERLMGVVSKLKQGKRVVHSLGEAVEQEFMEVVCEFGQSLERLFQPLLIPVWLVCSLTNRLRLGFNCENCNRVLVRALVGENSEEAPSGSYCMIFGPVMTPAMVATLLVLYEASRQKVSAFDSVWRQVLYDKLVDNANFFYLDPFKGSGFHGYRNGDYHSYCCVALHQGADTWALMDAAAKKVALVHQASPDDLPDLKAELLGYFGLVESPLLDWEI